MLLYPYPNIVLWHMEHILIEIYAYIYHAFQLWHHICKPTISCLVLGKQKHGFQGRWGSPLYSSVSLYSLFIISRQIECIMCRLYISNEWSIPIRFQFFFLFINDHWWSYSKDQIALSKRTTSKMFVEFAWHPLSKKLQVLLAGRSVFV